jgi:arylsulfatase A-like enzyme
MTGRYQQRFGHEDNPGPPWVADKNFGLPEGEKTMGDYLKAEGYSTCVIGKWHLGHRPECHPQKRGFDEFFGFLTGAHSYTKSGIGAAEPIFRGTEEVDEKEYLTDAFAREAVSYIDRQKDKPFFLYLPFNAVHHPLEVPERYKDTFSRFKIADKRKYMAMLAAMDDAIGKVLDKVRQSGLEEDTLIFFLGDNGGYRMPGLMANAPLSGFKGDAYEGGIRIPFLVQWKGKLQAGKVYDKPLISLDILPTAVAAAGGKPASSIEGVDLMPYLTGKKSGAPHDKLFWRMMDRSGARGGDWKLVRNGDGTEKLFNLAEDIGEKNDLAASNPDKLKELQAAYKEWDAKNIPPRWIDGRKTKDGKGGE